MRNKKCYALILALACAVAFSHSGVAKMVFKADFGNGLSGWKVDNSKTVVTAETIHGENTFVVRRRRNCDKKRAAPVGVAHGRFESGGCSEIMHVGRLDFDYAYFI